MGRAYRVGIAGGSCSGKTTLASSLLESLGSVTTQVVNMDRHMLHERGPSITLSSGEVLPNNNHPYSTDNHKVVEEIDSSEASVIIVEGLMALHLEEVRSRLDLRLFVETDVASRAIRRMVRSQQRRPDLSPEWIGRYYLECALPGHELYVEPSKSYADFLVNGCGDFGRPVKFLSTLIAASLSL